LAECGLEKEVANVQISWWRCGGRWCDLLRVDLRPVQGVGGVYVIQAGGVVVYVGQATDLAARLTQHRVDRRVLAYQRYGPLYVTWAKVPALYRNGVEAYLINALQPALVQRAPTARPIAVNLP
jgi:hypothetical protein